MSIVSAARCLTPSKTCSAPVSSWILLHDPDSRQLRTVRGSRPWQEVFNDLTIPPDIGILGLAFTSRQVVFVPNVKDDDRWFDVSRVHAAHFESVFTVPLVYGSQTLGVVGLDSPVLTPTGLPGQAISRASRRSPHRPRSRSPMRAFITPVRTIGANYGRSCRNSDACAVTSPISKRTSGWRGPSRKSWARAQPSRPS